MLYPSVSLIVRAMGDSSEAPTSSVLLDPVESLTFHLQPSASPQAVLTIRNISEARKIAFKVKTTRPMRYLVRPNQGMLGPNMSASIMVILQQKDCDELLRLDPAERSLSNDKFLVQSSYVDDSFYELVKTKSTKEMADELTNMWAKADKKSLANKKLRCRFVEGATPEGNTPAVEEPTGTAVPPGAVAAPQKEVDVSTKKTLVDALLEERVAQPTTTQAPAPAPAPTSGGVAVDPAEIGGLKKKYEELVTFTVQLTAQRQDMMRELAATRQQLQELQDARIEAANSTLRQRKGTSSTHVDDSHAHVDRSVAAKDAMNFSLVHLLVCAIVFFLIGRFY